MREITNTNIRVGPGIYLALRHLSETSGISIGTWANLLVLGSLMNINKTLPAFDSEVQRALTADGLAAIGELFKAAGLEAVKNTSLSQLYESLLSLPKKR